MWMLWHLYVGNLVFEQEPRCTICLLCCENACLRAVAGGQHSSIISQVGFGKDRVYVDLTPTL